MPPFPGLEPSFSFLRHQKLLRLPRLKLLMPLKLHKLLRLLTHLKLQKPYLPFNLTVS